MASCSMDRMFCKVSTFNARRLKPGDFIDIRGGTPSVLLRFPLVTAVDVPESNAFSFKDAGPAITRPGARMMDPWILALPHGVSDPQQFLSGGLRFKCTAHPGDTPLVAFERGHDLRDKYLVPWQLSLLTLLRNVRYHTLLEQLVLDGSLTEEKIRYANRFFVFNRAAAGIPAPFIYDTGQPFVVDLSLPTRIRVLGPRTVIYAPIYPRRIAP